MNEAKERSMQELVESFLEHTGTPSGPPHYRLLKQLRDGWRAGVLCTMVSMMSSNRTR